MLRDHRLSQASLDAMAEGGGDPALVEQLGKAYRSWQLTLLRAVLDRTQSMDETTEPLPPLSDGWEILIEAQQRDPAAVDSVVGLPRTGVWANETLRLLDDNGLDRPLWTIVGYFHQMVVAAAIRAKCDVKWTVPVWRGTVLLPSLGLAEIPSSDEWGVAEVRHEGGLVVICGSAGHVELPHDLTTERPGWLPLRTLRIGEWELWLDDIDPGRQFGALLPAYRLSDAEVDQWESLLQETWQLLTEHHPKTASELAAGLSILVPCTTADRRPYSASHNDAFGSVVLSRPADATTCAELLVHEFGHNKLGVLLSLVDLLRPDGDNQAPRLYAPWRDDPRPAMGVLHGIYSFLGVTAFYRTHKSVVAGRAARVAQFEFEYQRGRTIEGIEELLAGADLTELGRRFLDTAHKRLHAWAAEPLPADIRDAAKRANLDDRLYWRIRQLRPVDGSVVALVEARCAGAARPDVTVDSRLVPVLGDVPKVRLALVQAWLSESEVDGATTADLALLDGDNERAVELYRQQVLERPESVADWAGLALASGEMTLLTHPELVFGVYHEIRARSGEAVDPVRLARWLS